MFWKRRSSNSKDEMAEPQFLHGFSLLILLLAISLTALQIVLDMSVIGTAIPSITTYFGTVEDVDWYGAAYLLSLCAIQPLTGQLYNIFRIKMTFVAFISVFILGNLVGALSKTSKAFIVGRAIAGIGGAGLFNGSMVMITAAAPPKVRAQFLSISVLLVGVGGVIGPVIGGSITQHAGWRWCLWIFLPAAGLTAILFLILRIPEQVKKDAAWHTIQRLHHKIDFIGFALFTPACIMFLLAMSWGGSRYGWDSATIIGLFVGSAAITGLFGCWVGHYKDRALIPPEVLFKPVVLYGCLVSFLQGGAFLMLNYYLPLWFQSVKGASPERGGVMMLPTCVSQIVSGAICAALLKVVPYAPIWAFFGNASTAIGSGLMVTFNPTTTSGKWIGYQVLNGIGRGIAMQMPILAAQAVLPPAEIAIATANMLFFQYFGGAVANSIGKTIFINALGPALLDYAPNVNAQEVIHAGATEIFKLVQPEDFQGVILAYNKALTLTFWLPTTFALTGSLFSLRLGWHKIRGPMQAKAALDDEAGEGPEKNLNDTGDAKSSDKPTGASKSVAVKT